jgi:very-short-patch-repair endonuclease
MKKCLRCEAEYEINMINKKFQEKNPEIYNLCSYCRKYKKCLNCSNEFNHKQNQTCSKKCAKDLKEKSWLISCGSTHNFSKNSSSRKNWEDKLLKEEGITNVFQREEVKEKSKITCKEKYGFEYPSRHPLYKELKKLQIKKRMIDFPNFYKEKWYEIHIQFINNLGYDPRLHLFGKASKESLNVFDEIFKFCLINGIKEEDIYIGIQNKMEYFLREDKNIYFYDFTIKSKKIIIEFHGIAFHAKNETQIWKNPFTNETAEENIKKRKLKNSLAKKNGFKLLEIWSDNLVNNNIDICKKFIIKNMKIKNI